jgi:tetratricopeptide (TPR) repeat protein
MKSWLRTAVLTSCLLACVAQASDKPELAAQPPENSSLDGVLFYQLLLGELQVRQGSPGAGFSLILDAARKTRDPALFQRAVDVALQSRSGDSALQAAQTWKRELPKDRNPNRYILQILLALNRIEEAGPALARSIEDLPDDEKQGAIVSIPRVFARVNDKALAAKAVESALRRSLDNKTLAPSAWTTIGRMHRDAQQWPQAIDAARRGHAIDPMAQGPLMLAMSLLPQADAHIRQMLDKAMQTGVSAELHLGYARSLIALQDADSALQQLQALTRQHPAFAPGWLLLGLLQIDADQTTQARQSLVRHVELAKDSTDAEQQAGLTEALMALSQLAQQQGDLDQAGRWLNQIAASADPVRVAIRRAQLLEQQGRAQEARVVLTQVQPATAEQAQRKTLALSRWMREHQQAQQAYELLQPALQASPADPELLAELSLVAEKLKRHTEMETVLRQLMQLRPQDPHAYNALGYSLADRGVRLEEARALILKAVELAPQDPYIQDSLGWVEFRMGRLAEAARILQAAYQAKPDAEIAAHLGEVLWQQGQKEAAGRIWREGLMLKSDNDTLTETIQRLGFKP